MDIHPIYLVTEADVKMAAYQECAEIAADVARSYGAMPAHAAREIERRIRAQMVLLAEEGLVKA